MIEFHDLQSGYQDTTVIRDLSLRIPEGQFLALLGRNGVGKTTLLKTLFGLCAITGGTISVDGTRHDTVRPERLARRGYSFLPDDRGVFGTLTVEENLRLARRRDHTPAVDVLELFPLLTERARQAAGSLSGGQQQQLGIARAVLAGKRLVAVDELSQGLQPNLAHAAMQALRRLVDEQGLTVLIVEQSPALPLQYCDRVVGMVKGQAALDEPIESVREDPEKLTGLLTVT